MNHEMYYSRGYYLGPVYPYGYYSPYAIPRPYPPVDTHIFSESVVSIRPLIKQAAILLDRLDDHVFSLHLMQAAQTGNQREVDRLIKAIGLTAQVKTTYTPSGVEFLLQQPTGIGQGSLTVTMKWGH